MGAIRRAVPDDASACRVLVRAAYQHYVARIGREPRPMVDDYDALIRGGDVWVVGDDNQLSAVLVLKAEVDHLMVENLAVAPRQQGTGLGSSLLAFAEDQARARHLSEVRLYTHETMIENIAFYPRRGYVETHRGDDNGFRRVYFMKQLT